MGALSIDSVGPEHRASVRHLMDLAFNDPRPHDDDEPSGDPDRVVGAFDGERLVGTTVTHAFEQVFGGRPVPCGGVAGVTVTPDARGRDAARRMLSETFERMTTRGEVISSLFPTTSLLYRSVGYDIAGVWARRKVPFRAIAEAEVLEWTETNLLDPDVHLTQRRSCEGRDGWVLPSELWWRRQAWRRSSPPSDRVFTWVGRRDGNAVASVIYGYGEATHMIYEVVAHAVSGIDMPAVRSALAFLAANGSAADELETTLPGPVLDVVLERPELARVAQDWPWMLRLVDLPGAIAARGYPAHVTFDLDLDVTDEVMSSNHGKWRLSVAEGSGHLEPGGSGTVSLDINACARLYAGADPAMLTSDGRMAGAPAALLDTLRATFASSPTLPIFF